MTDLRRLFEIVVRAKAVYCDKYDTYSEGFIDAVNMVLDAIEDIESGVA